MDACARSRAIDGWSIASHHRRSRAASAGARRPSVGSICVACALPCFPANDLNTDAPPGGPDVLWQRLTDGLDDFSRPARRVGARVAGSRRRPRPTATVAAPDRPRSFAAAHPYGRAGHEPRRRRWGPQLSRSSWWYVGTRSEWRVSSSSSRREQPAGAECRGQVVLGAGVERGGLGVFLAALRLHDHRRPAFPRDLAQVGQAIGKPKWSTITAGVDRGARASACLHCNHGSD